MTREELLQLIEEVQQASSEFEGVEIKSARGGTPQRLYEALSAFANRDEGGVVLFGLDEHMSFGIVGVGDAHRLQEDIGHLAASEMDPVLRPEFTLVDIDGKTVLGVDIQAIDPLLRPCYYKPAGLQRGSYIRVGLSNRVMTDYEVFGYVSARNQPTYDEQIVRSATLDDLDEAKLGRFLDDLRRARPQATYLSQPRAEILTRLGIVGGDGGTLKPTLAGLLVFGDYPQQYEPQLVITYLHYFGTTEGERGPRGQRFLDNRKFEGTIPEIVESAVDYVLASIRKGSLIDGLYRRDLPEYPEEAIREAIVNAVAHRDYSDYVRGSYIQIRLFADRLEIQSPGGLFGNVTEDRIQEEQSTRNRTLMRLMEDLHLVENRGSGIESMLHAMREANLEPPRFRDKRSSFWVTFHNHTLMGPEAIAWLNQFASTELHDRQRMALVYMRCNEHMTNGEYRRLNHVDSVTATRELRGLVESGLVRQHGTRGGAYYTLMPRAVEKLPPAVGAEEDRILEFVRQHRSITNRECRGLLGTDYKTTGRLLTRLAQRGVLARQGEKRGVHYVLP